LLLFHSRLFSSKRLFYREEEEEDIEEYRDRALRSNFKRYSRYYCEIKYYSSNYKFDLIAK
jgi:hypothetical protein